MTPCLSPNGQMRYAEAAPPTRLLVATATGVAVLERGGPHRSWELQHTALAGRHAAP